MAVFGGAVAYWHYTKRRVWFVGMADFILWFLVFGFVFIVAGLFLADGGVVCLVKNFGRLVFGFAVVDLILGHADSDLGTEWQGPTLTLPPRRGGDWQRTSYTEN